MSDLHTAAKLALETLEVWKGYMPALWDKTDEQAITALRQALANEALDKMAENARELGLDYEPAQQEPVDWEAVAADQAMTIALLMAELQEFAERQADAVEVALTESGWVWDGDQWPRPPQTWAGLTDEEVKGCFDSVPTQDCQNYEHWRSLCARNIEATLKEKNTHEDPALRPM